MQSFFKIYHHICEFCGHFSNFAVIFRKLQSRDGRFWKIAVTFLKLQSRDCRFRNLTAKCWKLQSHFELWLQLSTFCGHISNFAVTWLQILKCDRNFQHFAVRFRIMTATFNILQSHFELWLQLSTFCSHISNYDCNFLRFCRHISNYDCKMLKFAVTFLILQSEMDFWNWWRGIAQRTSTLCIRYFNFTPPCSFNKKRVATQSQYKRINILDTRNIILVKFFLKNLWLMSFSTF